MRTLWLFSIAIVLTWPTSAKASASTSENAYQSARKEYYRLKGDPARRKFRHYWLNVAHRFEAVAKQFPRSARAPDALFTSGELLQELSRISGAREDLDAAIADYQQLADHYAGHHLSDDAALALGKIYFERLGQPLVAKRVILGGIWRNPTGDRLAELRSLLASVNQELAKADRLLVQHKPTQRRQASDEESTDESKDSPGGSAAASPVPSPRESAAEGEGGGPSRGRVASVQRPKVRRVVIDPGHGGHDSGAIGPSGTKEKDVSLAIARRLVRILTDAGMRVALTRNEDVFVRLEDRAKMANEDRADLFISIHCNSAESSKLSGIETYTLNTSSNRYAIRLAARENAASEMRISDLQFILADLATKADADDSVMLASRVQHGVVSSLEAKHKDVKDLGIKQALFYVLLGVKMPAILVETSFISNRDEERRLASKAYQDEVARGIALGVKDFFGDPQRVAKRD